LDFRRSSFVIDLLDLFDISCRQDRYLPLSSESLDRTSILSDMDCQLLVDEYIDTTLP
jgi:hypothetical protein